MLPISKNQSASAYGLLRGISHFRITHATHRWQITALHSFEYFVEDRITVLYCTVLYCTVEFIVLFIVKSDNKCKYTWATDPRHRHAVLHGCIF